MLEVLAFHERSSPLYYSESSEFPTLELTPPLSFVYQAGISA